MGQSVMSHFFDSATKERVVGQFPTYGLVDRLNEAPGATLRVLCSSPHAAMVTLLTAISLFSDFPKPCKINRLQTKKDASHSRLDGSSH